MDWLKNIPEWLLTSLVGTIFAAIGYFGKSLVDWWQAKRSENAEKLGKLLHLQSLLKAAGSLFIIQQDLVKRLLKMLEKNHEEEYQEGLGYEETMMHCYSIMIEDEKVMHSLVRAYSEYSMRQINQAMLDWLKGDTDFKMALISTKNKKDLSAKLMALETHLLLWHAKYEYWIPNHPEHSLVYMADEGKHGLGFPNGLDSLIEETVNELRKKWK